jgi:hypothetical protein
LPLTLRSLLEKISEIGISEAGDDVSPTLTFKVCTFEVWAFEFCAFQLCTFELCAFFRLKNQVLYLTFLSSTNKIRRKHKIPKTTSTKMF